MRLFVALVPPADAVEDLEEFLAPRRQAADFRWAPAEQFHVTLAFMGSVEEWRIEEYVERLTDLVASSPVATVRLAGPVVFPDAARARVLATGVVPESEGADVVLEQMASRARSAAVTSGMEVDGQRFRSHVTLARMRQPTEASNWVKLLDTYAGPAWAASEIEVVASHLGEGPRGRPRHETLATLPVAR